MSRHTCRCGRAYIGAPDRVLCIFCEAQERKTTAMIARIRDHQQQQEEAPQPAPSPTPPTPPKRKEDRRRKPAPGRLTRLQVARVAAIAFSVASAQAAAELADWLKQDVH